MAESRTGDRRATGLVAGGGSTGLGVATGVGGVSPIVGSGVSDAAGGGVATEPEVLRATIRTPPP